MGKTPSRKTQRKNPYDNVGPTMPFVVLHRYEPKEKNQGPSSSNNRSKPYNRERNFDSHPSPSFQSHHYASMPGPFRGRGARGGNNNFYRRQTPTHFQQSMHQPSPQHVYNHSAQAGGWQQHASPMVHPPYHPQHPAFHQQQWVPPNHGLRGRRQQTPMRRGKANMSMASTRPTSKLSYGAPSIENSSNIKPSVVSKTETNQSTKSEWKRSPIKLRKSIVQNPSETKQSAQNLQVKTSQSTKTSDIHQSEEQKSVTKKRKSIETASVKRLSMPRNEVINYAFKKQSNDLDKAEVPLGEKRKSITNKRKSIETASVKRLSMPRNAVLNATSQYKKASTPNHTEASSDKNDKPHATKRKSIETASVKRLSMPRKAVLNAASHTEVSMEEKNKPPVNRRKSMETASVKRLSMPRSVGLSIAAPTEKTDLAKNTKKDKNEGILVKSTLHLNKRKTSDSMMLKRLSMPTQTSQLISVSVSKRKSLISAVPSVTVSKIEPKKMKIKTADVKSTNKNSKSPAVSKEESKKVTKSPVGDKEKVKGEFANKRRTRASVASDYVLSPYFTPDSSTVGVPLTRSKSCPRSPASQTDSFEYRDKAPKLVIAMTKAVNSVVSTTSSGSSKSHPKLISPTTGIARKPLETVKAKSADKNKTKQAESCLRSDNIKTRSQSRAKSRAKSIEKEVKRKRSLSEAPSSPPTSKKNKTTPMKVSKVNGTPSSNNKSGSVYTTPSRRQILLTPRSSQVTPKSRKSQPITPRSNNRAALMVQTVLDQQKQQAQQQLKSSSSPRLHTDIFRVGHSVAVQTVDPTDILSDYERLHNYDDDSSDEEDEPAHQKGKFIQQVNDFKQSLKGNCVVM